jgi:hypothetical protein
MSNMKRAWNGGFKPSPWYVETWSGSNEAVNIVETTFTWGPAMPAAIISIKTANGTICQKNM